MIGRRGERGSGISVLAARQKKKKKDWSSGDPFVCQSPIGVYVCHFLGQVLGCAYTIC